MIVNAARDGECARSGAKRHSPVDCTRSVTNFSIVDTGVRQLPDFGGRSRSGSPGHRLGMWCGSSCSARLAVRAATAAAATTGSKPSRSSTNRAMAANAKGGIAMLTPSRATKNATASAKAASMSRAAGAPAAFCLSLHARLRAAAFRRCSAFRSDLLRVSLMRHAHHAVTQATSPLVRAAPQTSRGCGRGASPRHQSRWR